MSKNTTPTHAGCAAYRVLNGTKEYLVITAKNNNKDKVLPKGHIEPNETADVAAIRELKEETGLTGAIEKVLACTPPFRVKDEQVIVQYFLVYVADATAEKTDENRLMDWLPIDEAIDMLTYKEAKAILKDLL